MKKNRGTTALSFERTGKKKEDHQHLPSSKTQVSRKNPYPISDMVFDDEKYHGAVLPAVRKSVNKIKTPTRPFEKKLKKEVRKQSVNSKLSYKDTKHQEVSRRIHVSVIK